MTTSIERSDILRALCQESVHQFTDLKRKRIVEQNPNISEDDLDALQPSIQEYDPVVQLAIMGADHSLKPEVRKAANADAAQYLRPKLKSIEMLEDPRLLESESQKAELAKKLVGAMELMAKAKSESS